MLIAKSSMLFHSCEKDENEIIENEVIGINQNAIIYSDVHDPAQLVDVNNELVLFASAVEWSTYRFGSNNWELEEEGLKTYIN